MPPHHTYIEPFGGSGAVLLNKRPAPVEIFNDIDSNIYNFFKVCRDPEKFQQLKRMLEQTPYCQQTFAEVLEKFKTGDWKDDVEWAWGWKVYTEMSMTLSPPFEATPAAWIIGNIRNKAEHWQNAIAKLDFVHRRLKHVQIAHRDGLEQIAAADGKDVLFYCDPPYVGETRQEKYYTYEADTVEFHRRLVEVLLDLKGMCILSCYWHSVYEPLLERGWRRQDFKYRAGRHTYHEHIETLLLSPHVAAYGMTLNLFNINSRAN